ncbi:MAG: sensor histidine kinase, partial [Nocardioidaceae bacterium]
TVQADSAPYRLSGLDDPVRREFAEIAAASRAALTEMRKVLGVLRPQHAGEPPDRAPQARLTGLAALAETVSRAGVQVELDVEPGLPTGALPPQVELTAYRVVQEALSNVVRHAPRAQACVSVHRRRGSLRVAVTNGPGEEAPAAEQTPAPQAAPTAQLGLAGMTERVEALAGVLRTGRTEDGGFRVEAEIPLEGTTP